MLNDGGIFMRGLHPVSHRPNTWMVVHGAGAGHEDPDERRGGRNAAMVVDEDLHDLSLQGPGRSIPGQTRARIRDLKYFHHMPAAGLFGSPGVVLAHRLHGSSAAMRFSWQGRGCRG